ncbi:hypothetical protein ACPCHT_31455 [Nucisporomicrobium flavum]|uniref:hypothetical protein n=1 Tax=Nucisporomicrobium flavum TaxID=2785915 RepID=UPI001F30952A|nr:hypothetical protein [Nucisporomicrobium flavum]
MTTIIALGIFLFALCAGGYAIMSGQQVKTIEGGKIEFYANDREYSSQDIADKQSTMQQEADSAQQAAEARRAPVESSLPGLAGRWSGSTGYTYVVEQYGDQLVFQEESPYGVTTVGQGALSGRRVTFRWQAFNGLTGSLTMTISSGADVMRGTLEPDGYPSQPFEMRRL